MWDVSCILQQASGRSLVLLDELGRSTAAEEGAAITWTVCEHLLRRRCRTLAATHYQQCARLADMYQMADKLVCEMAHRGGVAVDRDGGRAGRSWLSVQTENII